MSHRNVTLLLPGYTANARADADLAHATDARSGEYSDTGPRLAPDAGGDISESAGLAHKAPASFHFSDDLDRQPWQSQLAHILGLDTSDGTRLPGARLGLLRKDDLLPAVELVSTTHVVRADPIFLKADKDSATLIPPEQLGLSEADAAIMIRALNDFVAEDGLTFFSRGASEWYMSGRPADALRSYPPSFLANRNASTFLPDGEDAAPWRRLMTEIQMLLHSHPVNQQREQRGLMPVNSVWFWGGAALPDAAAEGPDVILYADEPQGVSLAECLDVACLPLADVVAAVNDLPMVNDIVVIDLSIVQAWLYADAQQLDSELARVNEQWLRPLALQVGTGQLQRVRILTEDGIQGLCDTQTLQAASAGSSGWMKRFRGLFRR